MLISYFLLVSLKRLRLARKYAWIFVRAHYLFRDAKSFPRCEEFSEMRRVFRERSSRKTVSYKE